MPRLLPASRRASCHAHCRARCRACYHAHCRACCRACCRHYTCCMRSPSCLGSACSRRNTCVIQSTQSTCSPWNMGKFSRISKSGNVSDKEPVHSLPFWYATECQSFWYATACQYQTKPPQLQRSLRISSGFCTDLCTDLPALPRHPYLQHLPRSIQFTTCTKLATIHGYLQ